MLPGKENAKGGEMCMRFSLDSKRAGGCFGKVPAADAVGTLEVFPVYYAGERGSPERSRGGGGGGKHFVATFTSFKCLGLGKEM